MEGSGGEKEWEQTKPRPGGKRRRRGSAFAFEGDARELEATTPFPGGVPEPREAQTAARPRLSAAWRGAVASGDLAEEQKPPCSRVLT